MTFLGITIIICFLLDLEDMDVATKAGSTIVAKSSDEEEKKPKIAPRKKRKTNVEKSLEAVFDKFHQFSNDEFIRYITVTFVI